MHASTHRHWRAKPSDLPEFKWINTVLGNLKTSLSGSYHAFAFRKYAGPYLAAFAYRFNRRFDLSTLHTRLIVATANCGRIPNGVFGRLRFVANQEPPEMNQMGCRRR